MKLLQDLLFEDLKLTPGDQSAKATAQVETTLL